MSKLTDSNEFLNDSKYRQYVSSIEKALKTFEYTTEWADLIAALGKLHKIIQNNSKYGRIPNSVRVSKRLSQCMHPALPFGVHLKTIECYKQIFETLGTANLGSDIHLYSIGFFPLLPNATINVKKALLELYEKYFIPLGAYLKPALTGFLNGVLPALEEGSEFFERTFNLLTQIESAVGRCYFFTCLWECVASSPTVRLPALLYASTNFDRKKSLDDQLYLIGSNVNRMVDALCSSADDAAILVQRQLLDFLLIVLPLDSQRLLKHDFKKIVKNSIFIVLRRDMSLNRRLYSWLLGLASSTESTTGEQKTRSFYVDYGEKLLVDGLLELVNDEKNFNVEFFVKILRLFMYLMDRPECGSSVLRCLFLPVLFRIRDLNELLNDQNRSKIYSSSTSSKQQPTFDDLMKVLNLLMSGQKSGFLWEFLTDRLEIILFNYSSTAEDNGEKRNSANDDVEKRNSTSNVKEFCALVEFLLNNSAQLPQSNDNNLHLNRLISKIFHGTSKHFDCVPTSDLIELINLCVKLFGTAEKLTASTSQLSLVDVDDAADAADYYDDDCDKNFRSENSRSLNCVDDGLKLFVAVCKLIASNELNLSVKRQLTLCVCRLLKEIADYPIYFFDNVVESQNENRSIFVDLLCKMCLQDDWRLANEFAGIFLYVYALSKSILQEHQIFNRSSSTSRRPSYATRVLLKPIFTRSDVNSFENSSFFPNLSKSFWNRLEPTTSDAHAASARILLYLHSVDETGGSSSCEDVMVNEMTSLDDNLRSKSLNKFATLWILWRRCSPEYFLPGYPARPFERAPLVMLNGISEQNVQGHLCRSWLDDCLEHNDLLAIFKILTLTLTHPLSARVSIQSATFRPCDEYDSRLIELRTVAGLRLYHFLGGHIMPTSTNGQKMKRFLLNISPDQNKSSPSFIVDAATTDGSTKFDDFDSVDDENETSPTADDDDESVEKIVERLMDDVLTRIESECDAFRASPTTTPRTSTTVDEKFLSEIANTSPAFERYSPTMMMVGADDATEQGEIASEASEFLSDVVEGRNRTDTATNVHGWHAHLLLYYESYESHRTMYAYKSLTNILRYAPRVVGQILVSSIRSSFSSSASNDIETFLVRHARSVSGYDFFSTLDASSADDAVIKTARYSGNMYFEVLLTVSLYYLRSVYLNSPFSPSTVDDVELNWRTKSTCVEFLTEFFRLTTRLTEEAGKSFAFYVADVLARCKFQKCLLHSIISTLSDEKLTKIDVDADESVSNSIVRFNLQTCTDGKLILHSFQASLLKLLEVVLELEYRVRNARSETSSSGVMLDKLSVSQHVSPAHSSSSQHQPLAFQRLFLLTVLNALRKNYRTHSNWLSLIVRTLPYVEKSLPTFVLHVCDQLCKNMEISLRFFDVERSASSIADVLPADYLANVLEVFTIICHFCLLDSSASGCMVAPTSSAAGQNNGSPTVGNGEKSHGDIFVNLFRAFTFADPGQNSSSPNKSETNYAGLARQQLFASFPHMLSTLCNVWAVTRTTPSTSNDVKLSASIGTATHVRRLILDLLSPLAVNHPRQFLSSMALVWLAKAKFNGAKDVGAVAQSDLVELLLSIKTFPLEHLVLGVLQTLKQPVRVKNIKEKDAFPLEVSLLEMVHSTLCGATNAKLKTCWPTVQQLITESLPLVQVASSKLHLFRIFADFVDRSNILSGDKSLRKDLQDVCHKLVDCLLEIVGLQLAQPTWLKRTLVVKDDQSSPSVNMEPFFDPFEEDPTTLIAAVKDANNNKRDAIACGRALALLAERLSTVLDAIYKSEDKDKLQLLLTHVWFNVYPFLKARNKKNAQNFTACTSFLSRLSQYPLSRSVWRKSALDLLCDPHFFYMDESCARHWMTVVDNLMTQDRHSFRDLLTRTAVSQSSGLFTSKEQEYELRSVSLKRLTFVLLSSELDQYQPYLPEIQERITENLRLCHVPHVYAEVLVCFRSLIVRLSPQHLVQFWPTIIAELVNVLVQIEQELSGENAANDYKCAREDQLLQLYLSACKLLEAFCIMPSERMVQFQMYSWVFFPSVTKEANKGYVDHATRIVTEFEKLNLKTPATNGVSLVRTKTLTKIDELYLFFRRFLDRRATESEQISLDSAVKTIENSILADLIEQWL